MKPKGSETGAIAKAKLVTAVQDEINCKNINYESKRNRN